jgi:hypothetical protein
VERLGESGARAAVRIAAVAGLCLLVIPVSWASSVFVALVPLGCGVWLVARAPWPRRARVAVSVGAVAATIGLFVLILSQLNFS